MPAGLERLQHSAHVRDTLLDIQGAQAGMLEHHIKLAVILGRQRQKISHLKPRTGDRRQCLRLLHRMRRNVEPDHGRALLGEQAHIMPHATARHQHTPRQRAHG